MTAFIVLEGPDGVGKTVQSKRLAISLREKGIEVVETREPTNVSPVSQLIRAALSAPVPANRLDWRAMTLLFSADRAWHVENIIRPALDAGQTVICDRYYLSTAVYQTAPLWAKAMEPQMKPGEIELGAHDLFRAAGQWIMEVNQWCPVPDLTLILHSAHAAERLKARGAQSAYDSDSELQSVVASLYQTPEHWLGGEAVVHINANGEQDEVAARVLRACGAALP